VAARGRLGAELALRAASDSRPSLSAGVDVTLQIGEGLPHVYQLLLGIPEAAQATEQTGKILRAKVR
jgi:epsilon-lactone hydrolase